MSGVNISINGFTITIAALFVSFVLFLSPVPVNADDHVAIDFFYSETCPHCIDEQKFLDGIESEMSDVVINRYSISDADTLAIMERLIVRHNAERYRGLVPLTFVGDDYFVGFDNEDGVGLQIIESYERQNGGSAVLQPGTQDSSDVLRVPFLGEINAKEYSLPALAVTLGFLDGFNVCSLGALVLILGLVLALKSRKKIVLYGGIFVATTAIMYGVLIFLWYKLFSFFGPYMNALQTALGVLGIVGGVYFFKEFLRMKKYGPTCSITEAGTVQSLFTKLQNIFDKEKNIFIIAFGVLVFAGVLTVVEFPCSAAVPVMFAGILAQSDLSTFTYGLYILLFVLFYMIDEIIIFGIAVYKLDIWMASPRFSMWAAFLEGAILIMFGLFYLSQVFL